MKQTRNIGIVTVISVFCIFFGGVQSVVAQGASGDWNATTVSSNKTLNLTGKVTIKGQITIEESVTLTINGNDKKIQRGTDFLGNLFVIGQGAKLIIKSATIDGNNTWAENYVSGSPKSNGVEATGSYIYLNQNGGSIELENVTLQNGWMEPTKEDSKRSTGPTVIIPGGENVSLIMKNCTIKNMFCTYGGSGVFVNKTTGNSVFTITDCKFLNNVVWYDEENAGTYKDGNQGGTIRTQGGTNVTCTIRGGVFEGNITNGQGGGIYWNAGQGGLTVKDNVKFTKNTAGSYGGGIVTMTKLDLQSAHFESNEASFGGGLAYRPFVSGSKASSYTVDGTNNGKLFEQLTSADLTLTDEVVMKSNVATKYGGGIFIESGNVRFGTMHGGEDGEGNGEDVFRDEPASMKLSIEGATIEGNEAESGGGIYMQSVKYGNSAVDEETISGLYIDSGTIQNNVATEDGGGIYLKGIPIEFKGEENINVKSNTAENGSGGGIYIDNTIKLLSQDLDVKFENAVINENKALEQGGGVYVKGSKEIAAEVSLETIEMTNNKATGKGGGLYLNDGSLNIAGTSNTISGNSAENGGGVCIERGKLKIEQCNIVNNEAEKMGGGLFVSNESSVEIDLTGNAVFKSNTADVAGGGMAMYGPVTLKFSGSLEENVANNGGGIYLGNISGSEKKTELVFKGGFIRGNKARGTSDATTGYHKSVEKLNGIGGGAFLDENTSLSFDIENGELGFYGNYAEKGADDIFANGNNTSVQLPNVTKEDDKEGMQLEDFAVPVNPEYLFWVKDYITNDVSYNQSPNGIGETDLTNGNVRYRNASSSMEYWKLSANTYDDYISVALGYRLLYATISKEGLTTDESAIFDVFNTANEKFTSVVLTGTDVNGSTVSKRIALTEGIWTVKENNWSWSYSPENGTKEVEIDVKDRKNNSFVFKNTKNNTVEKKKYDEAIKENRMGGNKTE